MILAHVILSGALVWIYVRGAEAKPWMAQGVRFGVAVALLTVVPTYMIYFVVAADAWGCGYKADPLRRRSDGNTRHNCRLVVSRRGDTAPRRVMARRYALTGTSPHTGPSQDHRPRTKPAGTFWRDSG